MRKDGNIFFNCRYFAGLNLDSRLRGNDGIKYRNDRSLEPSRNSKLGTLNSKLCIFILAWMCLLILVVPTGAAAMPPAQRTVLPNRLVLLVAEEHSLPFITVELLLRSGSRQDPPGQEGLARLAARGLLLGTSKRKAEEINRAVDFMGASLSAVAGSDYAALNLRVLKKDMEKGLDLFMEMLTDPVFPPEEIKREVEKTEAEIKSAEDQPDAVAEKAFRKELFRSAYGHPVEGTKESLSRLTRDAVAGFYRAHYLPNNAVLVVVGDITSAEVKEKLLPRLEAWKPGVVAEARFRSAFSQGPKTVTIDRPVTQANVVMGHAGVSRDNPDYYALSVMNYILGGGGESARLFDEIRVKRGLAYAVASFFDPHRYPGSFQVILQTKNASAREAIGIAREQMEAIRRKPVKKNELARAKKYLIGSFPMRVETQRRLADFLAQVEYYGLGLDYPGRYPALIGSVTRSKVQDVARRYLHPDQCIVVVVADLKEAGLAPSGGTP